MKLFVTWLAVSFVCYVSGMATLSLPDSANCGDQAELMCTSTDCNEGYTFFRGGVAIYNNAGTQSGDDPGKYSATVSSASQVRLTISNIQLSDAVAYQCTCGFDVYSAVQTLRYECRANKSFAEVTSYKKLQITVDHLYPQPSDIVTNVINPASNEPGTYTCGSSPTLASHFTCTWISTASIPDGNHGYTITVTTLTQAASVSGSFMIVTPTSPTISNLSTISNNRHVILGVQDTPLIIQCVSRGGIPAPTLAWYRGSTSTSPLAQSTTSDSLYQPDGTYTVTLIHKLTPGRRDDMTPFLCRVFYPGATTDASPDPSPSSAILYLYLQPDSPKVLQTGEAVSGGSMTLRCSTINGRPAPSIMWSYLGQTLTPTNTPNFEPTSETYTVVSVLQRPVSAVDNGQNATCIVLHTTLSVPLTGTINVTVKYEDKDEDTPAVKSQTALIPGIVTGVCVPLVITVIVLIICRWRKDGGKEAMKNGRRNIGNANASSDSVVECAMYESADHVQQRTSEGDLYSKPMKSVQTALYAVPVNHKKGLPKSATQGGESVYEYPQASASFGQSMPKKNMNNDGLVYADLEFNNNPKKSTIHGEDNATTYVQVDFTKATDPLPDSDV